MSIKEMELADAGKILTDGAIQHQAEAKQLGHRLDFEEASNMVKEECIEHYRLELQIMHSLNPYN